MVASSTTPSPSISTDYLAPRRRNIRDVNMAAAESLLHDRAIVKLEMQLSSTMGTLNAHQKTARRPIVVGRHPRRAETLRGEAILHMV